MQMVLGLRIIGQEKFLMFTYLTKKFRQLKKGGNCQEWEGWITPTYEIQQTEGL